MARPGFGGQPSAADSYRVGRRIRVPEVRVIGADNSQIGILPTHEALKMAEDAGLELVEVSPRAVPPVCRIMDFGKFKYETAKNEKQSRKHQSAIVTKEMKLRPKTDDHDLDFKLNHIRRFLSEGNKCRLVIVFRGREIVHPETGQAMLDLVLKNLGDAATVEQRSMMEGRRMVMVIGPKAGVINRPSGPIQPVTGSGTLAPRHAPPGAAGARPSPGVAGAGSSAGPAPARPPVAPAAVPATPAAAAPATPPPATAPTAPAPAAKAAPAAAPAPAAKTASAAPKAAPASKGAPAK